MFVGLCILHLSPTCLLEGTCKCVELRPFWVVCRLCVVASHPVALFHRVRTQLWTTLTMRLWYESRNRNTKFNSPLFPLPIPSQFQHIRDILHESTNRLEQAGPVFALHSVLPSLGSRLHVSQSFFQPDHTLSQLRSIHRGKISSLWKIRRRASSQLGF